VTHPGDAAIGQHGRVSSVLVSEAYEALLDVLESVDDEASWAPTGCTGWAVRDLAFHVWTDAQRALVALHTPAEGPADRDAVSYWGDWAPDPVGAANGRRHTRVSASMFLRWPQLRQEYADTARAVLHAARGAAPHALVATQGHVLAVDDLLSTLAVEATIHHLDLVVGLPGRPGPTGAGLAEARRVVETLLGAAEPLGWSDERCVRVGTGRAAPTPEERAMLRVLEDRLPVFC
jgi:hypothetical protein